MLFKTHFRYILIWGSLLQLMMMLFRLMPSAPSTCLNVPHQVTSPDDCLGEDPYIPEGVKNENTLPEWRSAGAAWKERYDGYRCGAWWGILDGQPRGDPVVLDAALDWPDCCALCSSPDGDGVAAAACTGWSFHPASGSCQLMSDVSLDDNVSTSWGANGTVNGCPGYFESPASGCRIRGEHGLCANSAFTLLYWGAGIAFAGLLVTWVSFFRSPWETSRLLSDLLGDRQPPRLVRAACVEVSMIQLTGSKQEGKSKYRDIYEDIFTTRDNVLFVVPQMRKGEVAPPRSRGIEQKMLSVLFSNDLKPLADRDVAYRCQTTQGLREVFSTLVVRAQPGLEEVPTSTIRRSEQDERSPSFDCLLLVSDGGGNGNDRPENKALLVGVLGERCKTCYDSLGLSFSWPLWDIFWGSFLLGVGMVILIAFSGMLLGNDATQAMAVDMFHWADYRRVAVICIVFCLSTPVVLLAWAMHLKTKVVRLTNKCPPAADGHRS